MLKCCYLVSGQGSVISNQCSVISNQCSVVGGWAVRCDFWISRKWGV